MCRVMMSGFSCRFFDIDMFLVNSIGWGSRFWCALRFGHEVAGRAVTDFI